MKKLIATILTLALILSLAACGAPASPSASSTPAAPGSSGPSEPVTPSTPAEDENVERAPFSIAALKGPTAMGLVQLMKRAGTAPAGTEAEVPYQFTLAGSADQVSPQLIKGELDMACVPANLASNLYHKTNGQIVTLAINTLGVIYIVETGETLKSLKDLAGKNMVGAGKGSTPEFGLRYLLSENNIDPDTGLSIDWKSEHSECVAALASGVASIALLPQPFVTVAQNKIPGLRVALDLTAEWDALNNGSGMVTGVIVARKDVVEANPKAVAAFLEDYAESVNWVNANVADAAQLISEYGIVEAAPIAQKALPHCNIVCITGVEMKEKLSGYLAALAGQEPKAVGGSVPGDDFYYGA
ncbi:MAG: ABC transporter substrate-binding protein [Ruminococcaceae bacterium]|nr:ABC transporter substrate-binding protein [Oscillospiraceae bacterium]